MATRPRAYQDRRQEWLAQGMLIAGAFLLALAVGRAIADWQQNAAESALEPVVISDASQKGFLPMLSTDPLAPGGQQSVDTRPPADQLRQEINSLRNHSGAESNRQAYPELPVRIVVPSIGLDAPIVSAGLSVVRLQGSQYYQWDAPDFFAAGWLRDSSPLGANSNTVLVGHHNIDGEVFRDLHLLEPGDTIVIFGQDKEYDFRVSETMILKEKYQGVTTRLDNAQWIEPTGRTRLTLVTCWPYVSNTHRLIVIAEPINGPASGGKPPPR